MDTEETSNKTNIAMEFDGIEYTNTPVDDDNNDFTYDAVIEETLKTKVNENTRKEKEFYDSNRLSNNQPLSQYANTYELEQFETNYLIIFNQVDDNFKEICGTHKDTDALRRTFKKKLEFEFVEYIDATKDELLGELDALSQKDFSAYGCIVIIMLVYETIITRQNDKLFVNGQLYCEKDILKCLRVEKNPSLITKPKIIIIQTGREPQYEPNTLTTESIYYDSTGGLKKSEYTLPAESDLLIVHSVYNSGKRYLNGSTFIQTLCSKIDSLAHMDFESILVHVLRSIDITNEKEECKDMMPRTTSTLIRKLYLKKYKEQSPETSQDVISQISMDNHHISPELRRFLEITCRNNNSSYEIDARHDSGEFNTGSAVLRD